MVQTRLQYQSAIKTVGMSVTDLLEWAKRNGAVFDPHVQFEVGAQGAFAEYVGDDYVANTPLFRIPVELFITPLISRNYFRISEYGDSNSLTALLLAKLKFDSQNTVLDNGVNISKFFRPYIDYLPNGREIGSPVFWDDIERDLIKGTDLYLSLDNKIKELLEGWHKVLLELKQNNKFQHENLEQDLSFYETLKNEKSERFVSYFNNPDSWTCFPAFLWASLTLNARGLSYVLVDKNCNNLNEAFIAPIVDLLNHSNEAKVSWEMENGTFVFKTNQILSNCEIFNNYGPKSNANLLYGYGFVIEKNEYDFVTLALRIPEDKVTDANRFGIEIKRNEVAFNISDKDPLPDGLVKLFISLVKRLDETSVTLRNKLEGLQQLSKIIAQKINILKQVHNTADIDAKIVKTSKAYRHSEKAILQKALETIVPVEKQLLKSFKPLSFKTIYKTDKTFANSLLLIFGITDYEKLVKTSDDVEHALLLWVMRLSNRKHYSNNFLAISPEWLYLRYQSILSKLVVTEKDVLEFRPLYKSLFPTIQQKIPEIYSRGDWSIKTMIAANKLINETTFWRDINNEVYFIEDIQLPS